MDDIVKRATEALEGVTPGPWKHKRTEGRDYGSFSYWVPGICMNLDKEKDARFIAAARELVPAMRDRIEADAKRIAELEQKLRRGGVLEIAAENNRVTEYMFHWEGRAMDAEARVKVLEDALRAFRDAAEARAADAPEWKDTDTVSIVVTIRDLRAALEGEK